MGERTCQGEKERVEESLFEKCLPNSDNANYLKQTKEELQAAYDSEQVEYLAQKCAEIEDAAVQHQAKRVWDTTNEITGRTSSATGRLKGKTAEVRLETLRDHFATLLGQPVAEDRNPVCILYRILFRSALVPTLSKNSIPASTHLPTIRHLT